ncbi:PIN domain-containing protein [Nocardia fluminea]
MSRNRQLVCGHFLAEAKARAAEVLVPAVVCAEVCRGVARTRRVETLVSRKPHDHPWQRPVAIVPADFDMARLVGAILHGAQVGSRYLADAHVVALCSRYGGGLIITSEPDDIRHLAAVVPLLGSSSALRTELPERASQPLLASAGAQAFPRSVFNVKELTTCLDVREGGVEILRGQVWTSGGLMAIRLTVPASCGIFEVW